MTEEEKRQCVRASPADSGPRDRMNRSALRETLNSWQGVTAIYLILVAVMALAGLGGTGVWRMEGMVADTAETMLAGGSLFVPELYGEIYTYKPPLVYWLAAMSMKLFGPTTWALRLHGPIATLLIGLAMLVLIGRVSQPRVGLFAAVAATTSLLWCQQAKIAEFDAVLGAMVGIAIAAGCHNLAAGQSKSSPWIWVLGYLALSAGFLAKGMPALMAFGPGLLVAAIVTRRTRQLWSYGHLAAVSVFATLVGTCLVLAWVESGSVVFDQPLLEAKKRGFEWNPESLRETFAKPFIIAAIFLPWSFAWPWTLAGSSATKNGGEPSQPLIRASWAFLATGTLMFMIVPTHESRYFMPLAGPAAIVSAIALDRLTEPSKRASRVFYGLGILFGSLTMVLAFAPAFPVSRRVLLAVVGAAGLLVVRLLDQRRPRHYVAFIVLAAAICAWTAETWVLRPHRARFRVLDTVAEALNAELPKNATVFALGDADHVGENASLYYYLERPVRTFQLGKPLPPVSSWVVLTEQGLRHLEGESPGKAARLKLIRRVDHPWRVFLLYQVQPEPGDPGLRRQLSAVEDRVGLEPLHPKSSGAEALGLRAAPQWYLARSEAAETPWDQAHARVASQLGIDESDVLFVEPDPVHGIFVDDPASTHETAPFAIGEDWTPIPQDGTRQKVLGPDQFAWHLARISPSLAKPVQKSSSSSPACVSPISTRVTSQGTRRDPSTSSAISSATS